MYTNTTLLHNSFTQCTHMFFHTHLSHNSFTHNFVTQLFHTQLCHTTLSHTTLSHTTLSCTMLSHTFHTPLFHTTLSYVTLSRSFVWQAAFFVTGVVFGAIVGAFVWQPWHFWHWALVARLVAGMCHKSTTCCHATH